MRQLVLVLGAGGQLGQAMSIGMAAEHEVVRLTRRDLDVTRSEDLGRVLRLICPDVIVNCAAYADVEAAERSPLPAFAVNAWAVRVLARAAAEIDATLVHFSTDFVFDGTSDAPPSEDAPPNPRSVYAMSKLLGEWFAADAPHWYVLRVAGLFGGPSPKSSIDRIIAGLRQGEAVRAFQDRTVSPAHVDDVVRVTGELLARRSPYGLYHCVSSGWTTWLDLAREAQTMLGADARQVVPIRADDLGLLARRPLHAAIANDKLRAAGIPMPTWREALNKHVSQIG